MNESAAYAVGASTKSVECLAYLCLVLGVTLDRPDLVSSVGELALHSISAGVGLHE